MPETTVALARGPLNFQAAKILRAHCQPRARIHIIGSMAQRKRKLKGAQSGRATARDNARELGRSDRPAVLFDLDGTLVDSVYHHVITWSEALDSAGIGLLSGGYGQEDLERAGAFRVYSDPSDLLMHIEQLGLPGE